MRRVAVQSNVRSQNLSNSTNTRKHRAKVLVSATALLAASYSARITHAANTADPVLAGATDLGTNTTATYTTVAGTTSDVEFLAATTYNSTLSLSANLSIGTMDDFNASAIAINGSGLLTLSTAANSVAPNAADLLYVASGANLSIQTSGGITFTPSGNVDDAGVLSLGTSPVTITAGTTLSFIGAGATTVGGVIANTSGAVAINNAGGTVTFSGTNAYTGGTNIYNGGLLSADVTSSLGNGGAVTINPGGTLRTLSTSGGSLGGGAVSLNNGTIQAGNGSVAAVSASLPGVLTFTGASTINLQDNGTSTAALVLNGATPGLVRNTNNAATLILNGATALNGTTDTLTVTNYAAGGNATVAGVITNGILPSYEVGTAAGSTDANFLTAGTSPANGSTIAGLAIKAYSGYSVKAAGAAQTFAGTTVYELQGGASTITSGQGAYGIKFDSGATLALGSQTLSIGGGNSSLGGIIFNGTGDSITGGTFQGNGSNGEVDIYTANSATISSNFTSGSGGGAFTFFGPGTLTLSGANVTSTNGNGVIAFNGNVIDNLTTGFVTSTGAPFVVNNGTLTLKNNNGLNGTSGVNLTLNALGTVDLGGSSQTLYRLQGGASALVPGGTITSSSAGAVLTLNNGTGGNNDTFYGNISSANLALIKLANNTETLSGLENYKGTTTVNAGTLTFAPVAAGVNDSLGTLSFSQGAGTVQSTYQGTGTTTLTFSNLTARTAGASGNFVSSGGTNGTSNLIVLTNVNGGAPVAKTLLDPGYFFGSTAYATVDTAGFLRAYASTDTNAVTATGTNTIVSNAASNVFLTGSVSGQTSATVNTLNLGSSQSLTLATGATFSTNGILGNGLAGVSGGSFRAATSGGELVVRSGGNNQVAINSPIVDNGTSSFTAAGGSIYFNSSTNSYKGVTTVDGGTLYLGGDTTGGSTATGGLGTSSGVVLNTAGNLTFYLSNPTTFAGSITTGTLESGSTITQAGTGIVTLGSVTNTGNPNLLTVLRNATGKLSGTTTPTGAFNLGTLNGNIILTDNSTVGSTAPTTVTQTGTGLSLYQISGASGSVVSLAGTGTTTITNTGNGSYGSTGQTVGVAGGTVIIQNGRSETSNVVINGGTLQIGTTTLNANRLSFNTTGQTFNISSGTLNALNTSYAIRFGTDGPSGSANGNSTSFTGTQTGGTVLAGVTATGAANGVSGTATNIDLGGITTSVVDSYALSGGIMAGGTLGLGAGTGGSGSSTFTLSGTGTLVLNNVLQGGSANDATAAQVFAFTGGTLSANAINATYLRPTAGGTDGTFTNAGGALAPGTIGTAGLTTITGNYAVTSGNASYAVDLGTTTQASGFQTGGYDLTNVTLTAALGGKLNPSLIGGFLTNAPTNGNTFTILQTGTVTKSATSLSGTFTNTEVGKTLPVIALTGTGATGLNSFSVTYNPGTASADGSVVLGNYSAANTYTGASGSAWDAAAAADWSAFDPGSTSAPATIASGAIAQFADNVGTGTGPNTVTLNSTRNIQGIQFSSATVGHNYTINNAGSGSIILDNTANSAAATITDSSAAGNSNAINVPITLNSNLAVTVTNAANSLTLGGNIGQTLSGATLTKSGAGALYLNGTGNTYSGLTTVSAGTLGGTGTVAGPITFTASTLRPGLAASHGTFTASSTLTLSATSTYIAQINGAAATPVAGTDYSQLSGGTTGTINLNGATVSVLALDNTEPAVNTVYQIINYTSSSATAPVSNSFSNLVATDQFGDTYSVTYDTASSAFVDLTVTSDFTGSSTPEPASLSLLGLGGIMMMRRRSRRKITTVAGDVV